MAQETQLGHASLLSVEARELYARLAAGESAGPGTPGLADLERHGLALRDPLSGLVTVVDLDHVEQRLRESVSEALAQSVELFAELPLVIRDLRARRAVEEETDPSTGAVFVKGTDAVNALISSAGDTAKSEILCAQPGLRTRRMLTLTEDRDIRVLKRGVAIRTLYHVSGRTNPAVQDRVRLIAPIGGQFRTLASPFLLMVLFDRRQAFLVDSVKGRPAQAGAWHVRDPAVAAFLSDVFEQQWNRGDDWFSPAPADDDIVSTPLQRAILRELCAGHDQQQIAKALGYSARTINAHLTDLRARLGFRTVYQLVHWWAVSPERELT
ncbi:helix-turn-helix transcriptional regulator [Streptomyces sp. NBC_01497]|uniref:helix-turn-helix transcriptional regulator n=1 Tax=Streptomyces sp. NBC_01497 TaxID=2903885 RepID=UPI002E31801F|nr:helix-turn-helix transcriptional regulator [Streptomyces sp. NBC_01497]